MNNFSLQSQFTLKEYRQIYYVLLYNKIWIILLSIFTVLFIICTCVLWLTHNYHILNSDYYMYATAIAMIGIWIPLLSLFTIRRNFKLAYRIQELTTYNFSDEGVAAIGESFSSTSDWENIYKVKIIKGWLILYHNRMVANMIKIEPTDEKHVESLKKFLKAGNFKIKLNW